MAGPPCSGLNNGLRDELVVDRVNPRGTEIRRLGRDPGTTLIQSCRLRSVGVSATIANKVNQLAPAANNSRQLSEGRRLQQTLTEVDELMVDPRRLTGARGCSLTLRGEGHMRADLPGQEAQARRAQKRAANDRAH